MKEQLITSLLWTDLYKITMGQAVFRNYHDILARYDFINRGHTQFPKDFAERLRNQVNGMADIKLKNDEFYYLKKKCTYLNPLFLDWFRNFRFNPAEVKIDQEGGDLNIKIEGPWHRTIYWEVPLMTTISQLYFQETGQIPDGEYKSRVLEKGKLMKEVGAKLVDFGTRRAFSTKVHEEVLSCLIQSAGMLEKGGVMVGTSNVSLAKKFDIRPVGTYAHEWVMGHAALMGSRMANTKAMEVWLKEFNGKLAVALSDTYTTKVFLESFNLSFARSYDGVRQDSGDPVEFAKLMIDHYKKLGIDPMEKAIVFSDGLDIPSALEIHQFCKGKIRDLYGIGTNLTNDVGVVPLNMVIKLFGIGYQDGFWTPVAKLSDVWSKASGDPLAIRQTKLDLGIDYDGMYT